MPKTKSKEVVETKPIHVSLKLAGQDQEAEIDNVLEYFDSLKIDRLKIKSNAQFCFTYNGRTFFKTLTIPQIKRFVGNRVLRTIVAKWINQNLGLSNTN